MAPEGCQVKYLMFGSYELPATRPMNRLFYYADNTDIIL